MKQRLLVMNGQQIVQAEQDGKWKNSKVSRAGLLRAGLYNLYTAARADKAQVHDGTIIYADDAWVYQQKGRTCVAHALSDFDKVPEIGRWHRITHEDGSQVALVEAPKLIQNRPRR